MLKRKAKIFLPFTSLVILFLILGTGPGQTAFESVGKGARTTGMGGAFVSVADDVHALYYNPAGLTRILRPEFSGTYGNINSGTDDNSRLSSNFVGFVSPIKTYGTLGLSWDNFTLQNAYQENTYSLTYAKKIYGKFSFGATLKRMSIQFTQDGHTRRDPVFNFGARDSASAYSYDFGFLTRPIPSLSAGIMLKNINKPNVSLRDKNAVPAEIKTGISWSHKNSVIAIDGGVRGKYYEIDLGGERWFWKKMFAARVGAQYGNDSLLNFTSGMGYDLGLFQIDYSFLFSLGGVEGTLGTHRVGLTLRFGKDPEILAQRNKARLRTQKIRAAIHRKKMYFHRRGLQYFNSEDYEVAIMQWEQALRIDPHHSASENGIAEAKKKIEKREEENQKRVQSLIRSINDLKQRLNKAANENKTRTATEQELRDAQILKTRLESLVRDSEQKRSSKILKAHQELKEQASGPGTYRVLPGESLRTISEKVYGDPNRWKEIYEANRDKIRGGVLESGEVLIIP